MTMKARWQPPVLFLLIAGLFWLLADSADVRGAVIEGLRLCATSIIPALFPFLVLSSLLISLGFGEWVAQPLSGLMTMFRMDGCAASALILGLVGGYPVGARTTAELYRERLLSRDEAERLLTFSNNSNPAFLISVLGVGVFHSVRTGVWLWLIHVLSALLTGLLLGRRESVARKKRSAIPRPAFRSVRLPDALVGAVQSGLSAQLSICAFVVFFYVLALPLRRLSGLPGTTAVGILELFSATPRLTCDRAGFLLAAGLSGWGGLSVLCQTMAVLSGSGLSARNCFWGKAVQGILSVLLALALSGYVLP